MRIRMSGGCHPTRPPSLTSSPEHIVLTLWTADPAVATAADAAGVDRVGVDLERLGKAARQRGRGTWLSDHDEHDLDCITPMLRRAQGFARINPVHDGTADEVESVLRRGAAVV